MRVEELRRLAEANGVSSRFRLADGRWNEVRPETLEAVLAAMGVDPRAAARSARPAPGGAPAPAAQPRPEAPAAPPATITRRGRQVGWTPPEGSLVVLES